MAQRTITVLSDDLDGKESEDIETVTFAFDGATYEIDLSKKNRDAMEKALTPYLNAARRATGSRSRASAPTRRSSVTPEDREWLRKNGFPDIKDRGRLPTDASAALGKR
ncbi:Lsr2 family protein [Phycicoccus sp. MAQZ13P-2]|uniref:histone-like nucleoid-structuring protein Lsr2 n=1 Tax=Phycicoccus mangrovi TaxID=2840470 RepID=UPI001C0089E4|nr:Lsr2 family protein [Phycicoccus mangrovi]MBT9257763.1 Lsr2 family protein [Phycicoccus mangrovi]MBT9273701.1 Lsr2 family protein [Phycicoccus mangrovi]